MVKNNTGGNKSKKFGRKHLSTGNSNRALREVEDEDEMYAAVVKLFGHGRCEVMCNDGKIRDCVIRNKFRGRGKRDNMLNMGTWVMVGLRSWEVIKEDKKETCDLLEVYSGGEKEKLKKISSVKLASLAPDLMSGKSSEHDDIVFSNVSEANIDMYESEDDDEKEEKDLGKLISGDQGEMIDIDDI